MGVAKTRAKQDDLRVASFFLFFGGRHREVLEKCLQRLWGKDRKGKDRIESNRDESWCSTEQLQ